MADVIAHLLRPGHGSNMTLLTGGQHNLCLSGPDTHWLGSPSQSRPKIVPLSTQAKTSAGCRLTFVAGFAVSDRRCAS